MEVGALPARLERGVTAGGQVGRALEGNVGVSGAFGGKCWCGWNFGGKVLVWAGLWRASAGVGVALEQKCECVWDDAQAGTGSSSLLVRVYVKQNSFCNPTLGQKLT